MPVCYFGPSASTRTTDAEASPPGFEWCTLANSNNKDGAIAALHQSASPAGAFRSTIWGVVDWMAKNRAASMSRSMRGMYDHYRKRCGPNGSRKVGHSTYGSILPEMTAAQRRSAEMLAAAERARDERAAQEREAVEDAEFWEGVQHSVNGAALTVGVVGVEASLSSPSNAGTGKLVGTLLGYGSVGLCMASVGVSGYRAVNGYISWEAFGATATLGAIAVVSAVLAVPEVGGTAAAGAATLGAHTSLAAMFVPRF